MPGQLRKIYIFILDIKPSEIEDDFHMPLADISFTINENLFMYLDYVDPFLNKITNKNINKTRRRNGNDNSELIDGIEKFLNIDYETAKDIFENVKQQLNAYIMSSTQARNDFPSFEDLALVAQQHAFTDYSEFNYNFRTVKHGEEMHIRATSVKHAIECFKQFAVDDDVDESYTFSSVQNECKEYKCLYLGKDMATQEFIIYQEKRDGRKLIHRFDSLRAASCALPLPYTIRGYYCD